MHQFDNRQVTCYDYSRDQKDLAEDNVEELSGILFTHIIYSTEPDSD